MSGKAMDPEPVRGLVNYDNDLKMESARKLAMLGEVTLLPGHINPWEGDLGELYSPADVTAQSVESVAGLKTT